jgi:hypothetical protein
VSDRRRVERRVQVDRAGLFNGADEKVALSELNRARTAQNAQVRADSARAGLDQNPADVETRWLLLRQLYIAHLETRTWGLARQVAEDMATLNPDLRDVALFDLARAYFAEQRWAEGRLALLRSLDSAPEERKWDCVFALARADAVRGAPKEALWWLKTGRATDRSNPCVQAARLVWRAQSGEVVARSSLARAYSMLQEMNERPLVGDFFAAELLQLLGSTDDARTVYQQFRQAAEQLGCIQRLGLAAELSACDEHLVEVLSKH